MNRRKQFKYFRDNKKPLLDISKIIGISLRTAKRWNSEFQNNNLVRKHGLSNRVSNFSSNINKYSILNEYLKMVKEITKDNKAEPYNFSYFVRYKLKEKCSLSTFKIIMKENLIASPWARKETKKAYNMILKDRLKKKSLDSNNIKSINHIMEMNSKAYFRKSRPECAGEISEMDASKDYWLGNQYSHLYASYDPATREITALHLEKEETIHGYFKIAEQLIFNGKLPKLFKGDCRSTFVINKKDAGALAYKDVNTQFGFVLNILGIKMENSSEPTFKGSIERFFRTSQNQLKAEFRERGIKTFEEANEFLKEYMLQYNNQYSIKAIRKENKFLNLKLKKEGLMNCCQ